MQTATKHFLDTKKAILVVSVFLSAIRFYSDHVVHPPSRYDRQGVAILLMFDKVVLVLSWRRH